MCELRVLSRAGWVPPHLREVRHRRIHLHSNGLPCRHMHALEAPQRLQRHALLARIRRRQHPEHHVVGVDRSGVRDVHGVGYRRRGAADRVLGRELPRNICLRSVEEVPDAVEGDRAAGSRGELVGERRVCKMPGEASALENSSR